MSGKGSNKHHQKKHSQPHGEHGAAQEQHHASRNTHVTGDIKVDFPPDLKEEYRSAQQQPAPRSKMQKVVELVTLGIVTFYASVTWWQGCLTRTAIKQAADNFVTDHAPYVWPTASTPEFTPSQPAIWRFSVSNY